MPEPVSISVVTPSLNQGVYIEETVRSVMAQDYPAFEHIVVDGGSTDGTIEILKKYPHLRWTSGPDSGRSEAVNKGLRQARGEIIGWLSSDDRYAPGVFKAAAAVFEADPDCVALIGRAEVVGPDGRTLFVQEEPGPEGFTRKGIIRFWKHGTLPQPSLFFRKKVLDEIGCLDESLKSYMDFDFFIRLAGRFAIQRRAEIFSFIRLHPDAGSVVDIREGTIASQLARISRRHWGRGPEFWSHALSYAVHWPRTRWRSHYQSFAFRARAALGDLVDERPSARQLFRSLPLFARYPAPYVVVGVKRVLRGGSLKALGAGVAGLGLFSAFVSLFSGLLGVDPRPGFGHTRIRMLIAGAAAAGLGALLLVFEKKIKGFLRSLNLSGSFSLRNDWPNRKDIGLAALLAAAVVALDLYLSGLLGLLAYPPYYDGAAYLFASKSLYYRLHHVPLDGVTLILNDLISNQAPLWNGAMVAHYFLLGEGEWQAYAVRFWPVFLILLAVVWTVRQKAGRRAALAAALVTALVPTISVGVRSVVAEFLSGQVNFGSEWYFGDLRPDFFAACLTAWAVLVLIQNMRKPDGVTALISGAFAGLAVLAKPSAFPLTLVSWGIALLYAAAWNRKKVYETLVFFFWALVPFAVIILPWVICGGFNQIIQNLVVGLTKYKVLYSNPKATLATEASYYWNYFPLHMGVVGGPAVLAGGFLAAAWSLRRRAERDDRLWGYLLVAAACYVASSATLNKNYFIGLFFYVPLWIFSWSAIASCWGKNPKNRLLERAAFWTVVCCAAGYFTMAAVAVRGFPQSEFAPGPENKRVTRQIAKDLRQILGSGGTFVPVTIYGFPNTLSYYMMDEEGKYQGFWVASDPTLSTDELVAQAATNKVIMAYAEDLDVVGQYFSVPPAWKPFLNALYSYVKNPANHYRKAGAYRLSEYTKPMGASPLGAGPHQGITVEFYVKQD